MEKIIYFISQANTLDALLKKGSIMLFFLLLVSVAFSQQKVTGLIKDKNSKPLIGAIVSIKGTSRGTVSDIDGSFTMEVPDSKSILVFSYTGYLPQEIQAGNKKDLQIVLQEDLKLLDEVVVVGYGTMKKSDITGSVSSIKSEDLQKMPMTSFDQGIQGHAAGVQVTNLSGAPGGQVSIRVRGGNSLSSSNEPLYVIDGFPITAGNMASGYNTSSLANNPLATINPGDIESIEILKDASAAAIYGSRGANGVVLITTKRGKAGKVRVSYDGYYGTQSVAKKLDFMNGEEYATMANVAMANAGLAPIYGGADPKWKEPSYYRDNGTDWQSLIFRTAPVRNHQITISGGSDNSQYSISGNYFGQSGVVLGSDMQRGSLRALIDSKVSNWIKVGTSLTITRTMANLVASEGDGGGNGVISGAITIPPTMPVYNDDGTFTTLNQTPYGVTVGNPYAFALLKKDQSSIDRVMANADVKFDLSMLLKGLQLQIRGGTDYSDAFRDMYYPSTTYSGKSVSGLASKSWYRTTSYLNENLLSYDMKFGKHYVNAVGGLTLQSFSYINGQATVSGFVNDIMKDDNMGAATSTVGTPVSGRSYATLASWLGRINYNYDERYLLTFTGRADGSSKFGVNNKWGFFPSVAAAWRILEEQFMKGINGVSNMKLRASYGITGNQGFSSYSSLASLAAYPYNFGGLKVTGFAPSKIPNSSLKWETTSTLDFGLDLGFMNNHLNFTADYYYKKTKDLLWNVTIPLSSGFSSIFSNHGSLENYGIELSLTYNLIASNKKGAFAWNTGIMYSRNRNKVLSMPGVTPGRTGGLSGHLKLDGSWLEEGYPVGIWKYYIYDGVYQNQKMLDETIVNSKGQTVKKYPTALTTDGLGSPKFKDLNQDGVIDMNDWTVIGDPNPDFIFSWTNNFNYRNFDLSIFINGSYGNDILNMARGESAQVTPFSSQRRAMLNYWTQTNTNTDIPAPRQAPHSYLVLSSWMIEDGSYIRLKNIVLGYRFQMKKYIESLRVYVSAQNLLTVTNYTGFDPEVNSQGQNNLQLGVGYNAYPMNRMLTVGINIAF